MQLQSQHTCSCRGSTSLRHLGSRSFRSSLVHSQPRRQNSSRRTLRCLVRAGKTPDGPTVAIVGVSGAVGKEFLRVRYPSLPLRPRLTPRNKPRTPLKSTGANRAEFSIQGYEDAGICKVSYSKSLEGMLLRKLQLMLHKTYHASAGQLASRLILMASTTLWRNSLTKGKPMSLLAAAANLYVRTPGGFAADSAHALQLQGS